MVSVAVKVRTYVRIYKMCVFIYTSSKRCICKYYHDLLILHSKIVLRSFIINGHN